MSKQYNTKLQERLEKFLKDENLSQAKAAPILGISQAALSQYRRSMYDKGDIEAVENKLKEFFQIQEEKTQNAQKAEPFIQNQYFSRVHTDNHVRGSVQADPVLPAGEGNCSY